MKSEAITPELTLNIDVDGEPEEILFYDSDNSFQSSEPIDINIEKGKYALVLLILFTAMSRKRNKTRSSKIQLSKKANEYTKTLAEAITNPSKNTKSDHWLVKIFGKNPNKVFFEAARLKKEVVYFLDNIKLTVQNYQDKSYSVEKMKDVFDELLANEKQIAKKIDISVEVKATSIQNAFTITRDSQQASLTFDSEIKVVVAPNYSTSLAVFWICSEASVYELFPNPNKELEIPKSKVSQFKVGSKVEIPEHMYLPIDTTKGTETCLVIAGSSKFTAKESLEMAGMIKNTLGIWLEKNGVGKPTFQLIKRKKRNRESDDRGFRLGAPKTLNKWEENLIDMFPQKITSLSFLHIPHR